MENSIPNKRLWIALPLLFSWLAGTVYAFWWFQVRDLRPFAPQGEQMAVFEGEQLAGKLVELLRRESADTTGKTVVVHFWNPDCACNKFNDPHVRQIIDQYRASGVQFVTVATHGQNPQQIAERARAIFDTPVLIGASLSSPKVTPAAAVLTAGGQLAYFGPYSEGAFCGANGGAFVEKALDAVLDGNNPQELNTLAFGCFCQDKTPPPAQAT
jgi:thiol-disulfide isomerase/thioredoxin